MKILNKLRKNSEKGFSLVELIVVVVILGILVAVAIPIYGNIQYTAKKNALMVASANAATSVGATLAQGRTLVDWGRGGIDNDILDNEGNVIVNSTVAYDFYAEYAYNYSTDDIIIIACQDGIGSAISGTTNNFDNSSMIPDTVTSLPAFVPDANLCVEEEL